MEKLTEFVNAAAKIAKSLVAVHDLQMKRAEIIHDGLVVLNQNYSDVDEERVVQWIEMLLLIGPAEFDTSKSQIKHIARAFKNNASATSAERIEKFLAASDAYTDPENIKSCADREFDIIE